MSIKEDRLSGRLFWFTAIKLNGYLGGGVSARFTNPVDTWEQDVYGHLEIRSAATGYKVARIYPVEWRPKKHTKILFEKNVTIV